jgi:hypothetical protein
MLYKPKNACLELKVSLRSFLTSILDAEGCLGSMLIYPHGKGPWFHFNGGGYFCLM